MNTTIENIIIVTSETRFGQLMRKFNTAATAKFYLKRKQQAANFEMLQQEDYNFKKLKENTFTQLSRLAKTKLIDKKFLPNYLFSKNDLIVVIGQDGLVANTAKYALGRPIIGVNPDPKTYDGVLLPFQQHNVIKQIKTILENNNYKTKKVTMAEAKLDDGQNLLAFNDLFIGPQNHSSARYRLFFNGQEEQQSSSGIIVSTGAGATGWMSSLVNMANGMMSSFGKGSFSKMKSIQKKYGIIPSPKLSWDTEELLFAVREPFVSKTSSANIVAGSIRFQEALVIESAMPDLGVIFSDGIQNDFIRFTTGMKATIGIAKEKANLVVRE